MKLYAILGAAIAVLAFITWQLFQISSLEKSIEDLTSKNDHLTFQLNVAEQRLNELTIEREEFETKLIAAQKARQTIQQSLNRRLQEQKPVPTECTAAIEFAIENKDDLKWPN